MKFVTRMLTLRTVSLLVLVAILAALTPAFLSTQSVTHAQGPGPVLAAPELTAEVVDATTVELSWPPVEGAARYDLVAWDNEDDGWYDIGGDNLTGTTYTHENLTAGTTYYYSVRAVDASGVWGDWSEDVPATPDALAGPVLAAPELTAEVVDATTVELSWPPVEGAARYDLVAWDNEDDGWYDIGGDNLTGTTYTHENLTAGTTYYYSVRAVDASGVWGDWSEDVPATPDALAGPVLAAPELTAEVVDATTVELSWPPVEGAARYDLVAWDNEDDGWYDIGGDNLTGTTYTHENLTAGTTYYYSVRAVDASGVWGDWSEDVPATPDALAGPVLAAPELTAEVVDATTVELSWPPVEGAARYDLVAWDNEDDGWYDIGGDNLTGTTYTHENLTAGTTYYYSVRAVDASGVWGDWSEDVPATPDALAGPVLAAPELTAEVVDATTVELSWPPVEGAARYDLVAWDNEDDGWYDIGGDNLTGTTYTHENLTAGTTYYYSVRAVDASGVWGDWSEDVPATPDALAGPVLAAPELTAEVVDATTVELSWPPVEGAARYDLVAWDNEDDGWYDIGGDNLTGTTYTHENLTAGTTYYYSVRAVDASGVWGDWSEDVPATPDALAGPVLAAPELTAEVVDATTVELSWPPVEGAARYEVWAWDNEDDGWYDIGGDNLTGTTYTHENLTAGTTYYYSVRAVDASGVWGDWSEDVPATPDALAGPVLAAPELTAEVVDATTVELSWPPVEGAARYEVWAWDNEDG